jgi:hypothetical protein
MKKISACPGWLELSHDRTAFVLVPERAEIVRKIFDLSISGLGSYFIADHLTRQKVPPFGASRKWDHTTIDSMLRNRATTGQYQPKSWAGGNKKGVAVGAPISNYYPAIIDEETFEAAQRIRRQNLAAGRGRKGNNYANLFTGLTTCAYCNGPVKFHSNKDYKSLICAQVLENAGCIRAAWSYKNFESSVLSFLAHPAFVERFTGDRKGALSKLAERIRRLLAPDAYDVRLEIALLLKQMSTELTLANAGSDPRPILPNALIRRDKPERFFEIGLWNGPKYRGIPIS